MAIHAFALKTIAKLLSRLPDRSITCFSYPDILAKPKVIANIFNLELSLIESCYRDDSREILNWHKNANNILDRIVDTRKLFEILKYKFISWDLGQFRDIERPINLNKHFIMPETSALVYDSVLHQCSNVCIAFQNILNAVCTNGFYLGLHPLNGFNSVYHNFSPVWLFDVLTRNGFVVEQQEIFRLNSDLEPTNRLTLDTPHAKFFLRGEYLQYTVARRISEIAPIDFDIIHSKFINNPASKL